MRGNLLETQTRNPDWHADLLLGIAQSPIAFYDYRIS